VKNSPQRYNLFLK